MEQIENNKLINEINSATEMELFKTLSMTEKEKKETEKNRKKQKIDKMIEEHIDELPEEERLEYQRLNGIVDLAKALGKEVPEDVKERLEGYGKKIAEMIGIINEEESENSEIPKDLESIENSEDSDQDLQSARELWKEKIRDINGEIKKNIIQAAEKFQVKVENDVDGNKLIEFSLNGKKYKILDPNIINNCDSSFLLVGVAGHEGMIGDDVEKWENKKLKKYVKKKQLEGFHIPNIEEMKNLLDELGNLANLHEEKDKIAMLMYITSMNGSYRLSMFDEKSRQILLSDVDNEHRGFE